MELKRLNLGCGKDVRAGWVNLDKTALPGVDVAHDLEKVPLPFDNDAFDTILCQNILEHLDYIPVLRDLHRILKKGGSLIIRVPHFTSRRNYDDPTHKKMFSIRTFEYFVKDSRAGRDYYFDFHFEKILKSRILFEKGFYGYNYLIEYGINAFRPLKETVFEATFLSRLFPAEQIAVTLIK